MIMLNGVNNLTDDTADRQTEALIIIITHGIQKCVGSDIMEVIQRTQVTKQVSRLLHFALHKQTYTLPKVSKIWCCIQGCV